MDLVKTQKKKLIQNLQAIAASAMSRQRSYPLGSLMATRNVSQVYPYKLAGPSFQSPTTNFNLFAGYYDLNTHSVLLRHFTWRLFYRTFMLFPSFK